MTNPTFSSFIALISPKGKEALYMGTYFLPIFLGNFLTTFVSGNLYEAWSDKLSLLKREMASREIPMQELGEVLTKEEFTNKAANALNMPASEVVDKFIPAGADTSNWSPIIKSIQKYASENEIRLGELGGTFSKNDYFASASEKLDLTQTQMTQLIWDTYNPNKIWYVIVGIGIVTILALSIYDKMVIRPKEKLEAQSN